MRKVKIGFRKKYIDYEYEEYCYAIIKYKKDYYIIKDNNNYSFIGDKIKEEETRRECIERIIKERTNISLKDWEEFVTIDEYNELGKNNGLENFVTFYLIYVDEEIKYIPIDKEKILLVNKNELENIIKISYQKEAIKILNPTFIFN